MIDSGEKVARGVKETFLVIGAVILIAGYFLLQAWANDKNTNYNPASPP